MDKLHQSLFSLFFQIQPILRAKDIEPCAAGCWWPLTWCGQQPEEEGSPTPRHQPWARPQFTTPQTHIWPWWGESPARRAQPSGSNDRERAGLLFPQGTQSLLECKKLNLSPCDACEKYRKKCTVVVSAVYLVLNEESLLSILRNIPFRIKQFKILILTLIYYLSASQTLKFI